MNRRSFISIITSGLAAQRAMLGLGVAKVAPIQLAPVAPSAPVAPEFNDVPYEYSYSTILGPHETLRDDFVATSADADFYLEGVAIGRCSAPFLFRLTDSEGRYLSHSLINSDWAPYHVAPFLKIPAAGRIGIDVTETSGAENGIEIRFLGVKRYRTGRATPRPQAAQGGAV